MKKIFYLIIDQLAGHWAENVKVDENVPPANVADYHELGLVPNFSYLIKKGIWVKKPWNKGLCETPHGMKYLATGCYKKGNYWIFNYKGKGGYYPEAEKEEGFFEYVKRYYQEKIEMAVFTSGCWIAKGYFYLPCSSTMFVLPPTSALHLDALMWRSFTLPWLEQTPDWDMVHVYFPMNDKVSFCPSYMKDNPHPLSSKHAYLLYLDKLVGEIIEFLKVRKHWDKTYLIIASDHAYHLGCSTAYKVGARTLNLCCDHPEPHDCVVWDFKKNEPTDMYSGCTRRTVFIVSGGAVEKRYRGRTVEEAEIIDVIPTIAEILGVKYECEGKSVIKQIL